MVAAIKNNYPLEATWRAICAYARIFAKKNSSISEINVENVAKSPNYKYYNQVI